MAPKHTRRNDTLTIVAMLSLHTLWQYRHNTITIDGKRSATL